MERVAQHNLKANESTRHATKKHIRQLRTDGGDSHQIGWNHKKLVHCDETSQRQREPRETSGEIICNDSS